ncbi:uncharacterized protein LOC143756615 [Siphateles boraxobius]|uniref:uncharacterized protein LOC143756615 n=1 Tax=Siphateles boraxobius TaxID=180520 RepID=UPI004063CD46
MIMFNSNSRVSGYFNVQKWRARAIETWVSGEGEGSKETVEQRRVKVFQVLSLHPYGRPNNEGVRSVCSYSALDEGANRCQVQVISNWVIVMGCYRTLVSRWSCICTCADGKHIQRSFSSLKFPHRHFVQSNATFHNQRFVFVDTESFGVLESYMWLCRDCGSSHTSRSKLLKHFRMTPSKKKRECILKALTVYMNEDPTNLVKEYLDVEHDEAQTSMRNTTLGIYVIVHEGADATDAYEDVGIIIEGVQILENLNNVANACSVMLGLIYTLNLAYPQDLRYTFEVFQKIFMELDAHKLSNKVQVLKNKLLS